MKEYDKRNSQISRKLHMTNISSNNVRHPATKTFTTLHPTTPVQTGPGVHLASCNMGAGSFLRGRDVALTTHTHLASRLKKELSCTYTPPLDFHGLF